MRSTDRLFKVVVLCLVTTTGSLLSAEGTAVAKDDREAGMLDVAVFPLMPDIRRLEWEGDVKVSFETSSDMDSAFNFVQAKLRELGWQMLESMRSDRKTSAVFFRGWAIVSATVENDATWRQVVIANHGDVRLSEFVLPTKSRLFGGHPHRLTYAAPISEEECIRGLRSTFAAAKWEPIGGQAPTWYFRSRRMRCSATLMAETGSFTRVALQSESMLPLEYPVPAGAENVRFDSLIDRFEFETTQQKEPLLGFFREHLAVDGWTYHLELRERDNPLNTFRFRDERRNDPLTTFVFKTKAGDSLFVSLYPSGSKLRIQQSLSSVASAEAAAKEAAGRAPSRFVPLTLNLATDGNLRFGTKTAILERAETLIALGERLRDEAQFRKKPATKDSPQNRQSDPAPLQIVADYACNYNQLLQLISLCRENGFTDLRFSAVKGEEKHYRAGMLTVSVQEGELNKTLNEDDLFELDGEVENVLTRMKVTLRTEQDSTDIIIKVEGAPVPSMERLPGHLQLFGGAIRGASGEDESEMSVLLIASTDLSYAHFLDFLGSCRKAKLTKIGFARLGNVPEFEKLELEKPVSLPKGSSELEKLRP